MTLSLRYTEGFDPGFSPTLKTDQENPESESRVGGTTFLLNQFVPTTSTHSDPVHTHNARPVSRVWGHVSVVVDSPSIRSFESLLRSGSVED